MKTPYFKLIRSVWNYGADSHLAMVGYYITFTVAQICIGLGPYAFGRVVDVLQNFRPGRLRDVIFWLCIEVGALLLFWVFHGPSRVLERTVALKIQQNFRIKFYEGLTHLPLKWHQDQHSGNMLTRLNRASTALHRFAENQFTYIEALIKFLTSISFLLWICFPIGLMSLLTSLLVAASVVFFDRRLIPLYDSENEVDNRVGAVLFDYVSNMTTVLTLRLGRLTHSHLFQRMMCVWPFFKKEALLNEAKWFTMMTLLSLIQALLLIGYIVHSLHATGAVMIGLVIMIFRYQYELNHVFFEFSVHYGELVRMNTDFEGIQPLLNEIAQGAQQPQSVLALQQWRTLEVSNLSFHHAPGKTRGNIFENLHFKIKRGEKVALIGSSGGGKSTLLNLLSGLYTPSMVRLKIDHDSFESLQPLQAMTTLVPQDPELFENTIAFNITLDLSTDSEEIYRVMKLAGFLPVLDQLPEGLQTDIREKGLNLSVGQKQRLALARGLFAARDSSFILMDEPTSSVDLPTEKEILSGVIHAFPESALIVSLHRLHLLPHFDTVFMLSQGQMVAQGPASQLLAEPGPVQQLWKSYQT